MIDNKETNALVRFLLGSTCAYVLNHIKNEKDQVAYMKGIARCYSVCSEHEGDVYRMRQEFAYLANTLPKQLKRRWFSREADHYVMAFEHALDVVNSVINRFVDDRVGSRTKVINPLEENLDADQVRAYLGNSKQD
jgi:hypothetical protein